MGPSIDSQILSTSLSLSLSIKLIDTSLHMGFLWNPSSYSTIPILIDFNSTPQVHQVPQFLLSFASTCCFLYWVLVGFDWIELLWFLILSWLLYAFCSINANFFALLCMFNCSSSDFWYCFMWVLICFHAILIFSELGLFFMSVISF